jgi:hypothetical protein
MSTTMIAPSSTKRVRQHRTRKIIQAIESEATWVTAAVQTFYEEHDIPASSWVRCDEVYRSEITDQDLLVSLFFSDWDEFLRTLNNPGVEQSVLRIGPDNIPLLRPRFLKDELNS